MGTTLPNGIWLPGTGEPIDWHITPTILGAAADNAISGRSDAARARRTLGAASVSEANTLKGTYPFEVGDRILRTDLQQIEQLKAGGWKVVRTLRAVAFTPDWPASTSTTPYGITPGNGQQAWCYWLHDDIVTVTGVLVWGSSTAVGTAPIGVTIPLVPGLPPRLEGGDQWCAGEAVGSIGANMYRGSVTGNADSVIGNMPIATLIFRGTLQQGLTKPMRNDFPSSWSQQQSSSLAVNYQYQTY